MRLRAVFMGVALTSVASSAHAADEAIFVDVRSDAGCPSQASFEAAIRSRTSRARLTTRENASRVFEVRLENAASSALTIVEGVAGGGRRSTRKVRAASCDEAMQALALATALAIDPNADTKPTPTREAPPPANIDANVDASVDAKAEQGSEKARPSSTVDVAPETRAAEKNSGGIVIESPDSAVRLSPFGLVNGAIGVGPNPLLGFGGGVELGYERSKLAPSIRISALHAFGEDASTNVGLAKFTWTTVRLDVCPLHLRRGKFDFGPCARGELGTLEGSGREIVAAKTQTSSWLAFGLATRARWQFVSPLFVEAEVATAMPTHQPRFYMQPDVTVHEVPLVVGSAAISLGLSIR